METVPFFIKIEGQAFSNHRSPAGVFKVEVGEEASIVHAALAAIQVAKDYVPFMDENPNCFTLRAFREDGQEVIVPRTLTPSQDMMGFFCGRAAVYPEIITVQ